MKIIINTTLKDNLALRRKNERWFKYVVENSKYVSISEKGIERFIEDLGEISYNHWSNELNLTLSEKEWILLAFIIESMNFCFWQKPKWKIEYNNEIISSSNALFYSVIREVESNDKFLDLGYLYNMDKETFKNIFSSTFGNIPLFDERYDSFKEVINYIYENNNFYNELFSIKTDRELLKYITDKFKNFDDKSLYKGRTIHFNKRATLLTNDLFYLSETINKNLKDVNNLSGCADYGIPRTFRDYNILIYNEELAKIIDNELELLHDSEMEIEIRANMLYVIELIKESLEKKGVIVNSVELDNLIWWMGKKNKKSPAHHTITIYY